MHWNNSSPNIAWDGDQAVYKGQLLLVAGNPDAEAPPEWRPLNA
jgi:hypothetical protein